MLSLHYHCYNHSFFCYLEPKLADDNVYQFNQQQLSLIYGVASEEPIKNEVLQVDVRSFLKMGLTLLLRVAPYCSKEVVDIIKIQSLVDTLVALFMTVCVCHK